MKSKVRVGGYLATGKQYYSEATSSGPLVDLSKKAKNLNCPVFPERDRLLLLVL